VKVDELTYAAEVKLLLGESLPFGGDERMEVMLNDVGAVDLPEHRQENLIDSERLLLVVKIGARLRSGHVAEDDKGAEDVFREHA
jgi:hypothetical protein